MALYQDLPSIGKGEQDYGREEGDLEMRGRQLGSVQVAECGRTFGLNHVDGCQGNDQ